MLRLPFSTYSKIFIKGPGSALPKTEIVPTAPASNIGNVNASSPDITCIFLGADLIIFCASKRSPVASFIAMIFL